jgi:hypothetical protein
MTMSIDVGISRVAGDDQANNYAQEIATAYNNKGDKAALDRLHQIETDTNVSAQVKQDVRKASLPVIQAVAKDVGVNANKTDWTTAGQTDGAHPIKNADEYNQVVQQLSADVQAAGDVGYAKEVADDILQIMPAGAQANNNFLGILGDSLGKTATNDKNMLLPQLVANELASPPDQINPAAGTEWTLTADQRDFAARTLFPDMGKKTSIVIQDWIDAKGNKHYDSLWHELSKDPNLFLTQAQQTAIENEAKAKGWTAQHVNDVKTWHAVHNLGSQP